MKGAAVAILDEPTGGLDPQSTQEFLELIHSLKHDGMTILLSSHLLDLVTEQLDTQRLPPGRREDVDDAAPDGELAALRAAVVAATDFMRVIRSLEKRRKAASTKCPP